MSNKFSTDLLSMFKTFRLDLDLDLGLHLDLTD